MLRFLTLVCMLFWLPAGINADIAVLVHESAPRVQFGVDDTAAALAAAGHDVLEVILPLAPGSGRDLPDGDILVEFITEGRSDIDIRDAASGLVPEGFEICCEKGRIRVIGGDESGLMYGGLELAEQIRIGGVTGVSDTVQRPYMPMRGTKFNIPLDVRTPSYTDVCDAGQANIAEMWDFEFWRAYIDSLARYRFNFVSLWSLHPFPSMVKVPEYPDVALADVQRSRVEWKENYSLNGIGFDAPEILGNVEILKRMTIEQKIEHWRRVMRYAKDRNVDFFVVTWNIFVNGTEGKYGITDDFRNPVTRDYFRKSIRQMFVTYPDLAGVGLTTGENMPDAGFTEKENWAFSTYGLGVLDAAESMPGRQFQLIHRQHQAGAKEIAETFSPVIDASNVEFLFSFKYAKAHVYSSVRQTYHPGFVQDIGAMKTLWTLRNDDVYHFRWGAPDFVRAFINNIPHEVSRGFYLGSDQYIWGREFLSRDPESPRLIEIDKHWYHWMIWGRLGYDPGLSNERLRKILGVRFPGIDADGLFDAWQSASMVYPLTTGFHWGALDFQWYIEACKSRPGPAETESGFHDVNRFITLPPHPGTENISIPDYVEAQRKGLEADGVTPLEVAGELETHAQRALEFVKRSAGQGGPEFRRTLTDIEAMAYLGCYYSRKIAGATALAMFRDTGAVSFQSQAIEELNEAAVFWRQYASCALSQYRNPLWTNRVGYCDWRGLMSEVLEDVRKAGGEPRLRSISMPFSVAVESMVQPSMAEPESAMVEYHFDCGEPGRYGLDLRYAGIEAGEVECDIILDGEKTAPLICWTTGGSDCWAWDRLVLELDAGRHCLSVARPEGLELGSLSVVPLGQYSGPGAPAFQ